jgi:hypothetical protein
MEDMAIRKLKAEQLRVMAARAEMEILVIEREDEIRRIKDNMKKQEERSEEITKILAEGK